MQTINLPAQANGTLSGWSSIVGGSFGYDAIDESDDSAFDGDTSYLILPRSLGNAGIMSFRFFNGAEGMIPTSIVIRTAMKINSGNPDVQVGFYRSGAMAFSVTTVTPSASYNVFPSTFSANPFNASAWAAGDLVNLEPCLRMSNGVIGTARVSLVSVELTYTVATVHREAQAAEDFAVVLA